MGTRSTIAIQNADGIESILTGSGDLTEEEIQDFLDDIDAAARELEKENG